MNNQETQKEILKGEIRKLIEQIEEKKIIYNGKLTSAQTLDQELTEIRQDINEKIKKVNELMEALKKTQ